MIPTKNDLPQDKRQKMVKLLNQLLADGSDLYSQLKQAHWNVKGVHFFALHELFDKAALAVEPFIDQLAERAVQLGGVAEGTVRMAAKSSSLQEYPVGAEEGSLHVEAVASALAAYAKVVRKGIDTSADAGDMGTSDLLTGLVQELDKYLWFVESHSVQPADKKKLRVQSA